MLYTKHVEKIATRYKTAHNVRLYMLCRNFEKQKEITNFILFPIFVYVCVSFHFYHRRHLSISRVYRWCSFNFIMNIIQKKVHNTQTFFLLLLLLLLLFHPSLHCCL